MVNTVKAVIFDLDGTLIHSELDFDLIRRRIGLSDGSVLEAMEAMSPQDRRRAMRILEEHESQAARQARLDEHPHTVLDTLAQRGIRTALLTRNSLASARTAMDRHNLSFEIIYSREDPPVKPSPQPVLAICSSLNVQPEQTLMVGDYLFDLQSANDAGARSVLIRNQRNAEFIPLAWRTIDTLDQLLDLLDL